MPIEQQKIDGAAIIRRMKEALNIKTDVDLSKKLNVSNKTISSQKKRNSIPLEIILSVSFYSGFSSEYILTGYNANVDISQIKEKDYLLYSIIGEFIFKDIAEEIEPGYLSDMSKEQIWNKAQQIGGSITIKYQHLKNMEKIFTEKLGASIDEFKDFALKYDELTEDMIAFRQKLKNEQ